MKNMQMKNASERKTDRVVRATFSLPASAIEEMNHLRIKLARAGHILNKSELIRVGIASLSEAAAKNAAKAIHKIDRLKAGRPKHHAHGKGQ